MIKLDEYIMLTKMVFQNNDYDKHEFKYRDDLIKDIISGEEIRVGDKFDTENKWKCKDLDKAKELFKEYPSTVGDFDKIMKKLDGPKFNKIFKGKYSGVDKEGQSDGEVAESLVCYLYNNKPDENSFNKWIELSKVQLGDIWKLSSFKTVRKMYELWPKSEGYVAIHTDGNDKCNIDDKIKNIAKLFKSKKEASVICHNRVNDMYPGTKKDKWNPADIILVNKNKIEEIYDVLDNEIGNGEALNSFLALSCRNKSIIPISLKQVGKEAHVVSNHVNDNDELPKNFTDVFLSVGKGFKQNTPIGSILLKAKNDEGNVNQIQFRSQTSSINNINIEAKISSTARGGKGISIIKQALKLGKTNDYYINSNSIKELENNLKNIGINVTIDSSLEEVKPFIGTRPCFAGFIGIANKYKEQNKDTYTPENLFKFIWISCTKCPGTYYIIY